MFEDKLVRTIAIEIAGLILILSGLCLVGLVDWRLAVGLFLALWGNNLTTRKA